MGGFGDFLTSGALYEDEKKNLLHFTHMLLNVFNEVRCALREMCTGSARFISVINT